MDLFERREAMLTESEAPLAARMRPRTLEEFVGQDHIMAPGRLLRRAIEADRLASLIFYGPPGTGKTTLAEVIALRTSARFTALNAVLSGVKDIRKAIEEARRARGEYGKQTVLFIDEVHRFNKAQQDALLPWVERGTVILIGATTENPYFEVNKALVSRSRIFQLQTLTEPDLARILDRALSDEPRGYGGIDIAVSDKAKNHLIDVASGDARSLLGALELAVETTPPDPDGRIRITLAVAEESIQRRAVLYDKEGDAHYDTISAFIKSLRGSDPDAALYWMARMVYAGEDPRFILRRMVIFASEDVGLAKPEAVSVVMACAQAYDRIGMPEGRFPLSQAAIYLATAPKSNSSFGFFDALAAVERERDGEVPIHLKDGSRDKAGFGHGEGYLYPHAYRDHWVEQQYLPSGLQGRLFYQPSNIGYEATIHQTVHRRRDAQLAAMLERDALGTGPTEVLTYSPEDKDLDRWMARTSGEASAGLAAQRDRIFDAVGFERHHVALDLNAGAGLLTWEAARRCPEGGVYARCSTEEETTALRHRAEALAELRRPIVLTADIADLGDAIQAASPDLRFDRILGRNALTHCHDRPALLKWLAITLAPAGQIVLLEGLASGTQRLYDLVPEDGLPEPLMDAWKAAEEAIYTQTDDPMIAWDEAALVNALESAGLSVRAERIEQHTRRRIPHTQLSRWFPKAATPAGGRPSYADRLRVSLDEDGIEQIARALGKLGGKVVEWRSQATLAVAKR